jgi:Tol biopolymer transport system component
MTTAASIHRSSLRRASAMRRILQSIVVITAALVPAAAGASGAAIASSTVRFLTTGSQDYWPCFSPDGTHVLFSRRREGTSTWELFIVPTAGGEPQKLASSPLPVSATRANWSMRNNLIAFTGTSANGENAVWLINAGGSSLRRLDLRGTSDQVFYPSWFPDGDHIAAMDGQELVIKRIDLGKGIAETVTDHQQVLTGMPSVSPDGKWIAFAGQKNAGQRYDQTKNSIWLVGDAGRLRALESSAAQGRAPTWSPDGERLTFESDRGSFTGQYAIFLINRDGTGLAQLTDRGLGANHPVWSSDGRYLAFSARDPMHQGAIGIAIISMQTLKH